MKKAALQDIVNRDIASRDYIPYTSLISDDVVKTVDGAYCASWRVSGITFETTDQEDLSIKHQELNQLLRGLEGQGQAAIWTHRIRMVVADKLDGRYQEEFSQEVADRYYRSFHGEALKSTKMRTNETYLTVLWRPYLSQVTNNPLMRMFSRGVARSVDEIRAQENDALRNIDDLARQIEAGLKKYEIVRLGCYEHNGIRCSHQLEFYGFLVNGVWSRVGVQRSAIRNYLATSRLLFVGDKLEIRTGLLAGATSAKIAAGLDLKDYAGQTRAGILNGLLYSPFDYIETQSFSLLTKPEAREALKIQKNQLRAAADEAATQVEALDLALNELIDGKFVLGEYHYSLFVIADGLEAAGKAAAEARTRINDAGFQAAPIDLVADAAWFAQLPGNWKYRSREAKLTSRNFASLSCLHGFGQGKREANPWGEAVTILKTPNGTPYYFNWHNTPEGEDSFDKKAPANTTIIGMTGSGKTVLELFLLVMSLKYEPTIVFFDKDRGAEICIRALGGNYRRFKRGEPTGMNPFQIADTGGNRRFLERLVKSLIPRALSSQEEGELSRAIGSMYQMEPRLRRLSTLRQMLPINAQDGGMNAQLSKWCQGGALGWLIDNEDDTIDLGSGTLYGFDDTDFLEDPEILKVATMYLLHCTETLIDGRRFIYVMAEFWKRLELPEFTDFAVNKQYTIRKQNGFGVFDTQSPAQILKSKHVAAMVEQCATQIFLPNPRADVDDYVKGFKVTQKEYEIIRTLGESSRKFLVKQGNRSTVVHLDLGGLNELLDILSTTTDNVEMLDEIRSEVGDAPEDWLPVFREKLSLRRNA